MAVPHGRAARTVRDVTENQFQAAIIELATLQGWLVYHTYDSRRSTPGFPDLCMVRDRVLFRELKVGNAEPSDAQDEWINRLDECGADVDVWTPQDWDAIEATLRR